MSLIACPECGHQVSSAAPTCPGCGAPIATSHSVQAIGVPVTTVEETSKRLKLHMLVSVVLICSGVVWMIAASQSPQPAAETGVGPTLMIMAGLFWYAVSRFRIWWHHR